MKTKFDIYEADFETYISNALKSHGYLFPETDRQMSKFEESAVQCPLPECLNSPDFVFESKERSIRSHSNVINDLGNDINWAIAARDGKEIPDDVLKRMKQDKAEAKKKQDGNK